MSTITGTLIHRRKHRTKRKWIKIWNRMNFWQKLIWWVRSRIGLMTIDRELEMKIYH